MKTKIYKSLVMLLALFSVGLGQAQISITSATPVTENFNTMGISATASLPSNWRMSAAGVASPTYTLGTNVTATLQQASSGNPATGSRYNWGNSTNTADRAPGFMTSGSYASPSSIMAAYVNNTGLQINDLGITFDYERSRINTNGCTITFFTSTDGTNWTVRATGDHTFGTGASAYNFNEAAVAKSVTLTGVNIANAGTFYLRWTFTNASGNSNGQGTGLDNVSVTATLQSGTTPAQLAIISVSPSSPTAGNTFDVTVQSQDGSGLPANVAGNTGFTLSTNGNGGAIGGVTTGTITAGTNSVVVTGVTLSQAGTGVTVTATRNTGDVLTPGISSAFAVLEAADHLTFAGIPTSGVPATNLSSFTVEARRPDNSVDASFTGNVTVSKASGPGTLSGTTMVAAVAGVATFSALQFDQAGSYTLNALAPGLSNATSSSIAITQTPVTWNFATAAPSSGTPFANVTVSNITSGNSFGATTLLSSSSVSSGYAGASGTNNAGVAANIGALNTGGTANAYFQFTLTPAAGYYVALSGVSFGTRSTTTAPRAYSIRSSKDNYATDIATGTIANDNSWNLKSHSGLTFTTNESTATIFRIYGYNGTGSPSSGTTNWRIDDVILTMSAEQCVTPTAFMVTGGGAYCPGGSGSVAGLAGSQSGHTYQLQIGGVNSGSPVSGTGNSISFGNQMAAGDYSVIATNTVGGCTAAMTGTVTVSVAANPTVTVTSQSNVNCNGGSDGSITVSAAGGSGFMYSWAPSGGTAATASSLAAGTYTATVTNSDGCTGNASAGITEPATPLSVTNNMTQASCSNNDGAIMLNVSGGTATYNYSWSNGATTQNVSGLSIGSYTATVTDANGCTGQEIVSVTTNCAVLSTQLSPSQCGQTVPDLSGYFYATAVAGAQDYEWEFTNPGLNYSFTTTRGIATGNMPRGNISGLQFGQTYTVRVRAKVNNTWGIFGNTCAVTIGAFPTTSMVGTQCGQTIPDFSGNFAATAITGAQDYEWEFTNAGLGFSVTVVRGLATASIAKTSITGLQYGQSYDVRVRAKVGGTWGTFGSTCTITMGPAPTPDLVASQCGQTLNLSGYFNNDVVAGAQDYEWEFTNTSTMTVHMKRRQGSQAYILRSSVPGLQNGASYDVRVRAKIAGVWGNYGNTCMITINTSAISTQAQLNETARIMQEEAAMEKESSIVVIAYPNPFSTSVSIAVSGVEGEAQLEIYNALGEKVYASFTSNSTTEVDLSAYNNGMYHVVLLQGDKHLSKTIIKQ